MTRRLAFLALALLLTPLPALAQQQQCTQSCTTTLASGRQCTTTCVPAPANPAQRGTGSTFANPYGDRFLLPAPPAAPRCVTIYGTAC